jgi:hypothetical protein
LTQRPATRSGRGIECPICLTQIDNWGALSTCVWSKEDQTYQELVIPASTGPAQRAYLEQESAKRCPNPLRLQPLEHFLPADYGSLGAPVVLGFVGLTRAGKSHLLTAMVGAMRTGLQRYGISSRALDPALHEHFYQERVQPLLGQNKILPGTREGIQTFADGFVLQHGNGDKRPVIMFDVAGGDLTPGGARETKRFLNVADGLFFVVDPTQLDSRNGSDRTFDTVLDQLRQANRLPGQVSAAVVVAKSDLLRFDEPVTQWLRSDSESMDADEFLHESRDVYAFLHERKASAWTLPYDECSKATLHFASATGGISVDTPEGKVYPRGVNPRRVLRPLVAMLAMTGVFDSGDAGKVGS